MSCGSANRIIVSIVVPSFNQFRYIEKTIKSLLIQNYKNIEIIVVDGGSTDGTVEFLKQYEHRFDRLIIEKDEGQADAIDKGFKIAKGDILAWLNTDDLYVPDAISKVADFFEKNLDVDFLVGDTILIDSDDNLIYDKFRLPVVNKGSVPNKIRSLIWGSGYNQSSSFWRRTALINSKKKFTNYKFCMDRANELSLLEVSKFAYIPEYLSFFRIHNQSKTSRLQMIKNDEDFRLNEEYKHYASNVRFHGFRKIFYEMKWKFRNKAHALALDSEKCREVLNEINCFKLD